MILRDKKGRKGLVYINAFIDLLVVIIKGARHIVGNDRGLKMMHNQNI